MNIRTYEYRYQNDPGITESISAKSSSDASHELADQLSIDRETYDPRRWVITGIFVDGSAIKAICELFQRHMLTKEMKDKFIQHADVDQGLLLVSEFASFLATRRDG